MSGQRKILPLSLSLLAFLLILSTGAVGQSLHFDSIPAGIGPVGMDIAYFLSGPTTRIFAAVANSGDDSVSIFELKSQTTGWNIEPTAVVRGIPAPNGVSVCDSGQPGVPSARLVVTSPSANSIAIIQVPQGNILGTVKVGPQPFSAACFLDPESNGPRAVVSNAGDSTLMLVDLPSLAVIATVPNVTGSGGFRGVAVSSSSPSTLVAWVTGTSANVVTAVDLLRLKVLTQVPVQRPTAIRSFSGNGSSATMYVASSGDNSIKAYDRDTAQLLTGPQYTFTNIPNPQDFVFSGLGTFATIGGQDSLWRIDSTNVASSVPNVPGAAALSTFSFGSNSSQAVVLATSTKSNSVFLIQQQPNLPADFRISNGASFATFQVAPDSLVSLFATTGVSRRFDASSVPLPATLGGVTLRLGGSLSFSATSGWTYSSTGSQPAGLLNVLSNQINFQIPPGIAPGTAVPAQLTRPDGTTLLSTVNITATAPGIFSLLQNGQGQGAVLNLDYSLSGNPQSTVGAKPAARGSTIQIFATGGGDTTPLLPPGAAADPNGNPLALTIAQPTVTIGGVQAKVTFSGMAPGWVGLWQINAEVPQSVQPGNAVSLVVASGGASSNTVTIAVQ